MGFNQPEVDSFDQNLWRQEQKKLCDIVKDFCDTNNIAFSFEFTFESVVNSNYDRIVMMWIGDLIPSVNEWYRIDNVAKQLGKKCFVVTDNIGDFPSLDQVIFFSYPEMLGSYAFYNNYEFTSKPNKLYNCFIQRVDAVRQSWFYFLHSKDLLDKGYVSLLMKQLTFYSSLTGRELFDFIHFNHQLDKLKHFDQAYYELRDKIPYRNFTETFDLLPLINDSKYSLVLETYAVDDDVNAWCFTEKTLRDLQFPTISLVFAQKQGIQKLKDLGLDLGTHLDSIDQQNWISRQTSLLEILANDSIEYNYNQLYNSCKYNQNLLLKWKNDYQCSNFFDSLYDEVNKH